MILIQPFSIWAQEDLFVVYDKESGTHEEFPSYGEAYDFYMENKDGYEDLVFSEDDRVIMMEYGIVEFKRSAACDLIDTYHSVSRDEEDYINGCYGVDAIYLGTSDDGDEVFFMLNGDTGSISSDQVILHPASELDTRISSYSVEDGQLYHNIKNQLEYDHYAYSLCLDEAPSYLAEGKSYYSADGHYFYEDLQSLTDDLNNGEHALAVNEEPYYNYYQYLPHRSYTSYTKEELEEYFYGTLGLDGRSYHYRDHSGDQASDEVNRSQLYGTIGDFFASQDIYGSNALLMLAEAVNESAYGKSRNAFSSNNLFASTVFENDEERQAQRYGSIEESIYAHAKYFISARFSNHLRDDYHGTYAGNKLSGINVNYSIDPYYGERNASLSYDLDHELGLKDRNDYALGIIRFQDRVIFYFDEELQRRRFILDDVGELSLILLEECEDSYKVRLDHSFSSEYLYDPELSYAYVDKETFSYIVNADKIHEEERQKVSFDLDGGTYHGLGELEVFLEEGETLDIPVSKDGYEFTGFDASGKATYRKISSISLSKDFNDEFEEGEEIDLSRSFLQIQYEDGEMKEIPLNTDMIGPYDTNVSGEQILTISYCGMAIEKKIVFSEERKNAGEKLQQAIEELDLPAIKENIGKSDCSLSFAQIRKADYELMKLNGRNYVISDKSKRYNLSISGLDLSLPDKKTFGSIADTYYVLVDDIDEKAEERIFDLAQGYGFQKVEGLNIAFRFNYQDIELIGPAIVQIDIVEKQNDLFYSVYHLNDNGDIVKCRTTQSDNYIQFMIEGSGPYLVLSLPSVNEYDIPDNTEDLSYENMGRDNHKMNFELMTLIVMSLSGIIGIIIYYIVYNERKKLWRDFRRSLREAGTVREEKRKS